SSVRMSPRPGKSPRAVAFAEEAGAAPGVCMDVEHPATSAATSSAVKPSALSRAHLCRDDRLDAAAYVEITGHLHPAWLRGRGQIVENAIHGALVENALVAEAPEIQLQTLEFETHLVGNVGDVDGAEVRRAAFEGTQLVRAALHTTL